ncbi:hypothetical protein J6E39_07315 [bacterium]|nr:hypothetical protein [bacterium]
MDLLKKIFNDDEQAVGLCAFQKHFAYKVYDNVKNFNSAKPVFSINENPNLNMFALG